MVFERLWSKSKQLARRPVDRNERASANYTAIDALGFKGFQVARNQGMIVGARNWMLAC
ncbi:hypothetical protein BJY04DRAFT_196794 [Aspergillus karnatakaensis]|uniref:uncharacterized protein n=1 Tax=Aspergillus karnatakaensis TaxID=1810916 RepID=UPI003CCE3C27